MPRIRTVKPEFWKSEAIARLSMQTRLTFIGLWAYVDDNGVGRDVEKLIAAELYALEADPVATLAHVAASLDELSRELRITRYMVGGKPFLSITGWSEHQKIDRPNKPRYPQADEADEPLTCTDADPRDTLATPSRHPRDCPSTGAVDQGSSGSGDQLEPGSASPPAAKPRSAKATTVPDEWPPTPALIAWVSEHAPHIDPKVETEQWLDYHRAKGDTAKDWTASWRTWMRNAKKFDRPPLLRAVGAGPNFNPANPNKEWS